MTIFLIWFEYDPSVEYDFFIFNAMIDVTSFDVKTPYLVSYCIDMTISQLAVNQSGTMNLLNK
jgi:hypothetical protein